MFRIFAAAMLALLTLLFPLIALWTIPLAVIWIDTIRRRRAEERRLIAQAMPPHPDPWGKARRKALQSW